MDLLPAILDCLIEMSEISDSSDISETSSDSEFEYETSESETLVRITVFVENIKIVDEPRKEKISSEKALLMTIWYLGNTESFRQVSDQFNVSLSSAHQVIQKVLNFVLQLRQEFIKWPTREEAVVISEQFCVKQGIENIKNVKDGDAYVNRKGYLSLLIQGTVDSRKRFIDVYCGEPGSLHDAHLLRRSSFYMKAENDTNFFDDYFLLGDSAYPSLSWLQYLENLNINISVKIMACCVLHNIYESKLDDTVIEPHDSADINNEEAMSRQAFMINTNKSRREEVF
ncbi:hypothetical protein ILUMI_01923 [Ignelater luminosus]|uniref:DDE Tnp4 domain-containing protein n=1 Tax=Ignelater luminosus TaxID=2038154 RepID=A0A8K0GNQ6_IGNLU|nr:hypothetical protein ILUMI_01923 [Ignelater luminosus]